MGHKRERRPRRRPASHAAGVPQLADSLLAGSEGSALGYRSSCKMHKLLARKFHDDSSRSADNKTASLRLLVAIDAGVRHIVCGRACRRHQCCQLLETKNSARLRFESSSRTS